MHCVPLNLLPHHAAARRDESLCGFGSMVGENEKRCTYPRFVTGAKGELIFHVSRRLEWGTETRFGMSTIWKRKPGNAFWTARSFPEKAR